MSLQPELSLLLECSRPGPDRAAIPSLAERIDPERFAEMARWHGVAPLAAHSVGEGGLGAAAASAAALLAGDFQYNALHAARLSMELVNVERLLAARGIPCAAFKGAVIASVAYGSLWLRQFSDIDVLAPPERVVEARQALSEAGYQPALALSPAQEARHVQGSPFAYSFSLMRPGAHMAVDLHWSPAERNHPAFPRRLREPWTRLVECSVGGSTVQTFSPEDTLLFLSGHAAKHAWERLRWIADIAWLIAAEPGLDWCDALDAAREQGPIGERTLLVSLRLAQRLLGARLPADIDAAARDDSVTESIVSDVTAALERASDDWPLWWPRSFQSDALFLRMAETPGRKAAYFLRFCAYRLAAPDAKDRAALALPGSLSFLYFVLRPFRLLREYGFGPVRSFVSLLPRLVRNA